MESVKKTDLEDQRQGIVKETGKTKEEVSNGEPNSATSSNNSGTGASKSPNNSKPYVLKKTSLLVNQAAAVFKPFMRMILKVCQKVCYVLGYILTVICLIFMSILFILTGLTPTAIILWNIYGLLSYVFGLENILTITCWVPVVGIVVLVALFVIWKIMALVYEGLTKLWTEP